MRGSNPRTEGSGVLNKKQLSGADTWWVMRGSNPRTEGSGVLNKKQLSGADTWWVMRGSNPRPSRCKRDALAN